MSRLMAIVAALGSLLTGPACAQERDGEMVRARAAMVEAVRREGAGEVGERVLRALGAVERHRFVPDELVGQAYANRPLPIGEDQTISQPLMVAIMTELLDLEPGDRVLEVGTGSGYQAAVLAEMGARVWSIEIVPALARSSAARLKALGYGGVTVREGDGYAGWSEEAPFDAVIVTAGADHVPEPLVAQLKPGGRMVIPVGPVDGEQTLILIEKDADGRVTRRERGLVRFVPLTRRR